MLAIWPAVREADPSASLDIYYDWALFKQLDPDGFAKMTKMLSDVADQGVVFHGGVSQPVLHAAMRRAGVWAYPHDGDIETFCITGVKMLASGCTPVTTTAGALPEILGAYGDRATLENFKTTLVSRLLFGSSRAERAEMRAYALKRFSWSTVAENFLRAMRA